MLWTREDTRTVEKMICDLLQSYQVLTFEEYRLGVDAHDESRDGAELLELYDTYSRDRQRLTTHLVSLEGK